MRVLVQEADFDAAELLDGFGDNAGAIVTFTGLVRNNDAGDLRDMLIEHYPGMTETALQDIAQTAMDRWSLGDCLVVHRYGQLKPGARIMMVATASRHRNAAFEAAEFLMDYLKSRAPFWKSERTQKGANWVAAKEEDEAALDRW